MPHKKTHRQKNIAKARASRWATSDEDSEGLRPIERYTPIPENSPMTADRFSDPEEEENSWDGGVHVPDSEDDFMAGKDSSDQESLVEFEGEELEQNLRELKALELKPEPTMYDQLCNSTITWKQWKSAEAGLGYSRTGNGSTRTQEQHRKETRERKAHQEAAKTS